MERPAFDWDEDKNSRNIAKHGVPFALAQYAFADPGRVIAEDTSHSAREQRYFCFGRVGEGILTVRFTYRSGVIRIFGAGYGRKGKETLKNVASKPKLPASTGPVRVYREERRRQVGLRSSFSE